ncbi:hypothetical protein GE09DRAFT_1075641 [Coniochaeta sp. 2T2.1]|nr:hypothetical protein GE09DRAFT_1075641 [Coniochaeta sp. 2T2.1]
MAPIDLEAQFQFLISCIKYSKDGKIDFVKVANDQGVVSKGAAAKRYERLMKAHGIAPRAALAGSAGSPAPASSPAAGTKAPPAVPATPKTPRKRTTKKRKMSASSDDEDEVPAFKQEVKSEIKSEVKSEANAEEEVKQEAPPFYDELPASGDAIIHAEI